MSRHVEESLSVDALMNKTWSDMSVVSLQEETYAKDDALKRVDVLVGFACAQNLNTASTWFEKHFAADNVEIRCKKGGFNTCIESKTLKVMCQDFLAPFF